MVVENQKGQHSLFIFVHAPHIQGLVAVGIWSFGVFEHFVAVLKGTAGMLG